MTGFEDFKNKSFIDQMTILTSLGEKIDKETLNGLFQLYGETTGDKTVDAMVEHTLRDVLAQWPDVTIQKLSDGTAKEKKLCLQVIGKEHFINAAPVLMEMAEKETQLEILTQVFIAMSKLQDPAFLDTFRRNVHHHDEIIAGISIEMIGKLVDTNSENELQDIILSAGENINIESLDVITAEAIDSLGQLADDNGIIFLVSQISHNNPTARRMIHENLVRIGPKAIPFFKNIFQLKDNEDKQINAANILGRIGDRNGGNILVNTLENGDQLTPNIRAAIYEALGFVQSMKGTVALVDALSQEENFQVLIVIVTSLEMHVTPGMIEEIREILLKGGTQAKKLADAIIVAHAVTIFHLLLDDPQIAEDLVSRLLLSKDQETLSIFAAKLETLDSDYAATVVEKIKAVGMFKKHIRILVVDDSRAMLLFYRRHLTCMDMEAVTVSDGQQALSALKSGTTFNAIITDLNMPVMGGLELIQEVRKMEEYSNIPIILSSTESERFQKQFATNVGINCFITKPIEGRRLMKIIRECLSD